MGQISETAQGAKFLINFGLPHSKFMGHLTSEQRYKIEAYHELGKSLREIADYVGKDKSVISRELKRNSDQRSGRYKADLAHRKAQLRQTKKTKRCDFTEAIETKVKTDLEQDYSPEQIVGRAKVEGKPMVSIERIYQYIWEDKRQGGTLYKHLRTKGKRYQKRGNSKQRRGLIKDRVDIDQRPAIVETKERFGDLEIDLIIGKEHKEALLTINDRATGILFMDKVPSKEAQVIEEKAIELLGDWIPLIYTMTSDNGKEFANHKNIAEALNIDFFFAKPYHSWQRGANENLNGLVRQYFPKSMSFENITQLDISAVVERLNNRPRKRFDFKSPNEMLAHKLNNTEGVAFIY